MKRPRNKLPLSPLKLCVSALIHTAFTFMPEHTDPETEGDDSVNKEAILSYIIQLITNSNESDYSVGTGNGYSKITEALKAMDFGVSNQGAQEKFIQDFTHTTVKMGEANRLFEFIRNIRYLLDFGGISTIQDSPIVNNLSVNQCHSFN